MVSPVFPYFRLPSRRLKTLIDGGFAPVHAAELCNLGFFYDDTGRRLCCLYCGVCHAAVPAMMWGGDIEYLMDIHDADEPNCVAIREAAHLKMPAPPYLTDPAQPLFALFMEYKDRRGTFTDAWPAALTPIISKMAANGFFYTGSNDLVCCYYGGCLLNEWRVDDQPELRHLKESSTCQYAKKFYAVKHPSSADSFDVDTLDLSSVV